ncbi:MAG TPA: DUF2157 domain-containing protein [bacterium]|nr:DUF2157 domain-containing protein [bacterium]HPN30306.1 DUF2157 domain-containing protein [bacterium]
MIDLNITNVSNNLFEFAKTKQISFAALVKGLELSNYRPEEYEWKKFANLIFLVLGTCFLISGIFFFFAYNWNDMPKSAKFAIIESMIVLSTLFSAIKKPCSYAENYLLLTSTALVGVLLAVFGQIYQTGADAYQLFAGWTLLIAGWVFISNFLPIWTIFIVLINTSLILYWIQICHTSYDMPVKLFELLALVNFVFLVLFELLQNKKIFWIKGRWFPRIIYFTIICYLTIPMIAYIFEFKRMSANDFILLLCPLFYCSFIVCSIIYYFKFKIDGVILSASLLSCIIITTSLIGKFMFKGSGSFIILALIIIIQGTGAGLWLKNIQKDQGEKNETE